MSEETGLRAQIDDVNSILCEASGIFDDVAAAVVGSTPEVAGQMIETLGVPLTDRMSGMRHVADRIRDVATMLHRELCSGTGTQPPRMEPIALPPPPAMTRGIVHAPTTGRRARR